MRNRTAARVSPARYRAPMGVTLGISTMLAATLLAAPAHAQFGAWHGWQPGHARIHVPAVGPCESILQTRVVLTGGFGHVREVVEERTRTTCLGSGTVRHTRWVVVRVIAS